MPLELPPHVEEERRLQLELLEAEALEDAKQRYQMALALAYRAGYDLARSVPRRLDERVDVQANFWRFWREQIEGATGADDEA
jgi:hypothetical protein